MATEVARKDAKYNMATQTAVRESTLVDELGNINHCSKCSVGILLQAPTSSSPASAWLCRRCGSCYFARCQDSDGVEPAAGVRPVSYYEVMKAIYVHMDGDSCPVLHEHAHKAARSIVGPPYKGPEARKQKRYPCPAQVTVVPLGEDFRIAAQPARTMTTNLSGGGVAMVHSRAIKQPYLAIDFAASGINLLPAIVEITRVRQMPGAWEIAGKFISRILH
jgi:hypothetical protein